MYEVRVGHELTTIRMIRTSYHWPDEALIFWRFARETIANKAHFGHHSLPGFLLTLSSANHLQNLRLALSTHFGEGDLPLSLKTTQQCWLKHITSQTATKDIKIHPNTQCIIFF